MMGWGNSYRSSSVPLRYKALRQAIKDKGNRGHVGQVHIHGAVWARNESDDVVMKLHRTDIVTFHPDGTQTLRGEGWPTPLTQHWIWQATGSQPYNFRPNKWSRSFWMWSGCVFYDGMKVRGSELLSERKFPVMMVPSAEATVLRKQLTALSKVYKDFARFDNGETTFHRVNNAHDVVIAAIGSTEFNFDVYCAIQAIAYSRSRWGGICGWKGVLRGLQRVYEYEVQRRNLLTEKE